jgi:hypothetical protein
MKYSAMIGGKDESVGYHYQSEEDLRKNGLTSPFWRKYEKKLSNADNHLQ